MEAEVRRRDDTVKDSPGDVLRAYSPYLIIIAIFSIAQIPAVKDALAESLDHHVPVARPRRVTPDGEPLSSLTFNFNWPPAAHAPADLRLLTMAVLRVSSSRAVKVAAARSTSSMGDPHRVRGAGAGLRDEPVRAHDHARPVGRRAGDFFAFPSSLVRLAGVAVTGSASSNALFGACR